jgi:hypothetical protein
MLTIGMVCLADVPALLDKIESFWAMMVVSRLGRIRQSWQSY